MRFPERQACPLRESSGVAESPGLWRHAGLIRTNWLVWQMTESFGLNALGMEILAVNCL